MSEAASSTLNIQEMVSALSLQSVIYYSVSASLREVGEPMPEAFAETNEIHVADSDRPVETQWAVRIRHEANEFGVRIRLNAITVKGEVSVDVAAEYQSDSDIVVTRDVIYEFVNNVSLMQLFPYIRETVMTMSSRVFGEAILMPVFERGQLTFTDGASTNN